MPFPKGKSPNPGGKPAAGRPTYALAAAIRRVVDPQRLALLAWEIADSDSAENRDRLAAMKFLADNGYVKPVVQIEDVTPMKLPDVKEMSLAELMAERQRLAATAEGGSDEPVVAH